MKILNWNIEWATTQSARGRRINAKIQEIDPDLICLTEATVGMIPDDGYAVESDPQYGYPNEGSRRKVLLWSKQPWEQVDNVGNKGLPGGRFISGLTAGIRILGVCIPWRDAHVRTGRRDRALWQDHLLYLDALKPILDAYRKSTAPVCVIGDFNQRVPRSRQPREVAQRLAHVFNAGYHICTANLRDQEGDLLIDHVVLSSGLTAKEVTIIPKTLGPGIPFSDHTGAIVTIESI